MKMPEGFIRLSDNMPEGAHYRQVEEALNLLQEMSETLEFISNQMKTVNDHPIEIALEARQMLYKFKSWK